MTNWCGGMPTGTTGRHNIAARAGNKGIRLAVGVFSLSHRTSDLVRESRTPDMPESPRQTTRPRRVAAL